MSIMARQEYCPFCNKLHPIGSSECKGIINSFLKTNTMSKLNAKNLKQVLWETLNDVKNGTMQPGQADSIATQSREILRTVNTQLRVMQQSKRNVSTEVIDFAENND